MKKPSVKKNPVKKPSAKKPWYQEGLRFACTGCGQCCTGAPGYVWVSEAEIIEMAKLLNITPELFVRTYTCLVDGRLSLLEHPKTFDCVFLKEKKCTIYGARPQQCRTFPWWPENLKSRKDWQETAQRCEGINHPDSRLVTLGEIDSELKKN